MKSTNGFTLVELMIVVMIVGVLMAIALPSYKDYVLRSHRTDAHSSLVDIAARQERFAAQQNSYTDEIADNDGLNLGRTTSVEGYYDLTVDACGAGVPFETCYLITATATGSQVADTGCTELTYDSVGAKGPADCW
jgi:type IV pilus assembly protein PilE